MYRVILATVIVFYDILLTTRGLFRQRKILKPFLQSALEKLAFGLDIKVWFGRQVP